MPFILIVGLAVLVVLWNKSHNTASAAVISLPQAVQAVNSDPVIQQQITAQAAAVAVQVAYDVNTNQATFLKVGETIATTAIGGLATIASQTATGVFLFSATAWTVIGGVIAGILVLVTALRSETHLYANALVKNYENPFGNFIIQAQQQTAAGIANGTLGSSDVADIANAVIVAWAKYQDAMNVLQSKSSDWNIVATQSLENLDSGQGMNGLFYLDKTLPKKQLGNGFMTYWVRWWQAQVLTLQSQNL